MQKTFKVYNERVTWVTVDIPEGASDKEIGKKILNQYYYGSDLRTEEIPDAIYIEDEDGNDLSDLFR